MNFSASSSMIASSAVPTTNLPNVIFSAPIVVDDNETAVEDDGDDEGDETGPLLNYGPSIRRRPNGPSLDELDAQHKSRMSDQIRGLGILFNSRQRPTTKVGLSTSYIDQDDSGTYHPRAERSTPEPPKVRRVRVANRTTTPRRYRRVGYSYVLCFSFVDERSLEYLRSISAGPGGSDLNNESSSDNDDSDDGSGSVSPQRRRKGIRRHKPVELYARCEFFSDILEDTDIL
jgi:hypothetical protein